MTIRKLNPLTLGLIAGFAWPNLAHAELQIDAYGSARIQAESVNPDQNVSFDSGEQGSYVGVRDAYSRLGFNANWQLAQDFNWFGQLEIPFDIANWKVQDPYADFRDIRVSKVGLETPVGTLSYGQMWLPYYNAISYKVDRFSTYYSGYATYATFRLNNTVSYYSPDIKGWSFALAAIGTSDENALEGRSEETFQATLSYAFGATDLSFGLDDQRGNDNSRLLGFALGHQLDRLYFGAKYEVFQSDKATGYGSDGSSVVNVYADYDLRPIVVKVMVAEVEYFGDQILHLGMDYKMNKTTKLFAEYYQQESQAAISNRQAGGSDNGVTNFADPLNGGGNVLAFGVRYDF
jgi:predicted porin